MTNLLQTPRPIGGFGVIYLDPPWAYLNYQGEKIIPQRAPRQHYETLTLEELKAIPVGAMAGKNCQLIMWVIDSHLDQAIELGRSYGFIYKSILFNWIKTCKITKKNPQIRPRWGMGKTSRKGSEICLLFTKGSVRRLSASVHQVILEEPREHSQKPDCTYERIERLYDGPYLEIFSRTTYNNKWTVWGNQTNRFEAAE